MGKSHFDGQQYRPRSMTKTMNSSESMRMILMLWRAGVRTGTLITMIFRSLRRLVRSRSITILNILSMMKDSNLRWKLILRR